MLTDLQKEMRLKGIGASECAAIFGLHPYLTPYELWLDKTGQRDVDLSDNDQVWLGDQLEPVVANAYTRETGLKLKIDDRTRFSELSPYMLCHLDRIVEDQNKFIEIKTAFYNPEFWGDEWTEAVPDHYYLQLQHQYACSPEMEKAQLMVLFKNGCFTRIYEIKKNDELIEKIVSGVNDFWTNYVLTKYPPAPISISDVKGLFPVHTVGSFLEATQFELDALSKYKETEKKIEDLDAELLKHKTYLCKVIGQHEGIKYADQIMCTFRANKNGVRSFKLSKVNL